jgi:hypothetical protein
MHTILVEDKRKKKKSAPVGFLLVRKPTFASPMLGLFFFSHSHNKKKNKNKATLVTHTIKKKTKTKQH